MNRTISFFSQRLVKFLLPKQNSIKHTDYRRLHHILFCAMLFVLWGPALTVALLSYMNYAELLQTEERAQIHYRTEGAANSLSAMLESVTSVVSLISRTNEYEQLTTPHTLERILPKIKLQYNFIEDIGVIDSHGIQQAYAGPYDLVHESYDNQKWFQIVEKRGLYLSPIYLGHRNVPHFTIAVRNINPLTRTQWYFRATINAQTLQEIITTIKSRLSEDLFLVDQKGTLQTTSEIFGPPLSQYDPELLRSQNDLNPEHHTHTLSQQAKINGTPWTLILIEKKYLAHEKWHSFTIKLISLLAICLILSSITAYLLSYAIKRLVKKVDAIQLGLLREAEHTNKLVSIGRLAAGVGHEINNPLAIINQKSGLAEDLLQLSPDFEHRQAILDCHLSINKNIERCRSITHRLLGFARRGDEQKSSVQLNDTLREVLSFLENAISHNNIVIEKELEPQLPTIYGNNIQLQQIFFNIINNAIDAMGSHGKLRIVSKSSDANVEVSIHDNGPGISEEHLQQIFEPFFTTKDTGKGTGLGLSITYGLVKKMNGEISARSQQNRGTTFTISFPQREQA